MTLVQKVKANSSKWFKTKDKSLAHFYWQDGYGAFSVSQSHINTVIRYIKNQHKHHHNIDFMGEFLSLLEKNKVAYKEEFIWD